MARKPLHAMMLLSMFFSVAGFSPAPAAASAMKQSMDSLFMKIGQDFDSIAASSAVRKKAADPVDGYFFAALKSHQPYYALTRTSQKGVVINEVIRLVDKPGAKKQNVSREPWFKYVSTRLAEYRTYIKIEETGRYYLFWAAPVIDKTQKGKEAFLGAVTLKIDIWDCFCNFSKNTEIPFLVRLNKIRLYAHKWKDTIAYREELLAVPGVKRISVRSPRIIAAVAMPADTQAAPSSTVDSSRIKAAADSLKSVKAKQAKNHGRTIIGGIVMLLIIIIIVYFILVFRNRMVEWKINRQK
jgi:hypothetical protein